MLYNIYLVKYLLKNNTNLNALFSLFGSRETRRSTRYARNGSTVNGSNSSAPFSDDSSEQLCNQQRSSTNQPHQRTHHRNSYLSSVGSANCATRSGNNSMEYNSVFSTSYYQMLMRLVLLKSFPLLFQ